MKHKLQAKARQIAQSPITKKALITMKPEKSVWGFLGIVFFLIVPEIIAFIYGIEITAYAKEALSHSPAWFEKYYFDFLVMMFEEGGSWFNLAIAMALLIWFFF
jgi:CDP-diglyceride synthetase